MHHIFRALAFVALTLPLAVSAQTQTESFEGWNGTSDNWLPQGWTEKHTQCAWHVINPNSSNTLPAAKDGKYYAAVGYDQDGKHQDEWLFSPVYQLSPYGGTVEYAPAYAPLFLYRVTAEYVDYTNSVFKDGLHVAAADLQVWVRTVAADGTPGAWTMLVSQCEEWKNKEFDELLSSFSSNLFHTEKTIFLDAAAYQNQAVQLGFRYVGEEGNIVGIDKVLVNYATTTDIVPTHYDTPQGESGDEGDDGDDEGDEEPDSISYENKTLTYYTPGSELTSSSDYAYGIIEVKSLYDYDILRTFAGNKIVNMQGRIGPHCDSVTVMLRDGLYGDILWSADITQQYRDNYAGDEGTPFSVAVDSIQITGDEDEQLWVCYRMCLPDYYDYSDEDNIPDTYYYLSSGYVPCTFVIEYDDDPQSVGDYSDEGTLYCLMNTVGDGGLTPLDLSVDYARLTRVTVDNDCPVETEITNHGATPVTSATLSYEIGGEEFTNTFSFDTPLQYMQTRKVYGNVCASTEGRQTLNVTALKVNGSADNYASNNTCQSQVIALQTPYSRRLLWEEITGTWCMFCPRGYVALHQLQQRFPGQISAFSVHADDDLAAETYWWIPYYYGQSYPQALIDRYDLCDPFDGPTGDDEAAQRDLPVQSLVERLISQGSEGRVLINGATLSDDHKTITVSATAQFALAQKNVKYGLSFALVEDSVTFTQLNAYSSAASVFAHDQIPELLLPLWDTPYTYQQTSSVGRFSSNMPGDGETMLPTTLKAKIPYDATYTIDVPEDIEDLGHLRLVCSLIDLNDTNEAINCVEAAVEDPTRIEDVSSSGSSFDGLSNRSSIYDLQGRKTTVADKSGIYIQNNHKILVR